MTGLRSKTDHAYALKRYGAQACRQNHVCHGLSQRLLPCGTGNQLPVSPMAGLQSRTREPRRVRT